MLSNIGSDLRYAARSLSRRPGFAATAIVTLALGIGVNVALFSLFHQILLRPLPVAEPERLVNLSDPGPRLIPRDFRGGFSPGLGGGPDTIFSYPMFRDLERAQQPFVGIAAHHLFDASLSTGERARQETGILVSGSYFSLLGIQPLLGRLLGPQDDRVDGQAESVVLSHGYWRSQFNGDPDVLGRTLIVNGVPLTIVGVAPAGFHGTTVGARPSVFVPITITFPSIAVPNHDNRAAHWLHLFARLDAGVTRGEAVASINSVYRGIVNDIEVPLHAIETQLEAFRTKSLELELGTRGQSALLVPVRGRLALLFAVSGAVLLLCCANVAGLLLVRGTARTGEMAVRSSMGATRGRLASLLLIESLLLALPAALLSLPVALLALRGLASTPSIQTHPFAMFAPSAAFDVSVSFAALLVAIVVAVVSALAFGLLPLRYLTRAKPALSLQAYGVRQTSGKGIMRFRTALATMQIAVSMALLAMMGAFAQSLANIARVDLGFDVDSIVTFAISPETSGYSAEASARFYDRLEEQLAAIPGVSFTGSSISPLLSGSARRFGLFVVDAVELERLPFNHVSPGFFETLGIELLAGRDFRDTDTTDAPPVAIVNQRFVEHFRLGGNVVGRHIRDSVGIGDSVEIVGVVGDTKYGNVRDEFEPQLFRPHRQSPSPMLGSAHFYVRGVRPPEDLMDAVRETVARVDPALPIMDLRTMQQQISENLINERFVAGTSVAFAVLATLLAALGLYGVLAYSVALRSHEIGLRFALGAPAGRIRGMVLRQVATMALIGVVLGTAIAWLLGRAARGLLFGVEAGDPSAVAAAAALLVVVTLGAAYVPARRASRVDPMNVLRYE